MSRSTIGISGRTSGLESGRTTPSSAITTIGAVLAALEDAAWKQHCGEGVAGGRGKAWQQQLFIERVVAMEEKHLFVCGLQPLPDGEPALECGACGRCHASAGHPDRCGCGCKLARWCLS